MKRITPTPTQSKELNRRTTTMKAITQAEYGSPDVLHLQDIQKPEVGDDDVLLHVHAAGVHIGDWHVVTGEPRLAHHGVQAFRAPEARVRGMDITRDRCLESFNALLRPFQARCTS